MLTGMVKKRPDGYYDPSGLKKLLRAYLDVPKLAGGGAGCDLLAQAPRLRATAAKATVATILTNFTMISPPFVASCWRGLCQIRAN
jgi:hypothetical protein